MKALELIHTARTKKCRLEYSKGNIFDYIGFCYQHSNIWNWYTLWEDGIVHFDHSYNCANGKIMKGLRRRMTINRSMGYYN